MSITRFLDDPSGPAYHDEDGEFVLFEDHQAEVDELTKRISKYESSGAFMEDSFSTKPSDAYVNTVRQEAFELRRKCSELTKRLEAAELNAARYEWLLSKVSCASGMHTSMHVFLPAFCPVAEFGANPCLVMDDYVTEQMGNERLAQGERK